MNHVTRTFVATIVGFSLILSGCTIGHAYRLGPQTHFVYPNSNVRALGPVKVKVRGTSGVNQISAYTSEVDTRVYNEALSQVSDANLIIDYVRTTTVKYVSLLFVDVLWTEEQLEGTAAKMELS